MAEDPLVQKDTPFDNLTITKDMTAEEIYALARKSYGYIDTLFKTNKELQKLLIRAIKQNYNRTQFQNELESSKWFIATGNEMRLRGFEMRQYEDTVNRIKTNNVDKTPEEVDAIIAQKLPDSNYARGLQSVKDLIKADAVTKNLQYTEEDLDVWSKEIYNGSHERDPNFIKLYLNTKGTFGMGAQATGAGAKYLEDIRTYAGAQGFDLDKDFSQETIQGWQKRLDMGDSLQAIHSVIQARAMIGQPTSVQNLMKTQGLTLTDIYSPFVQRAQNRTGNMNLTFKDSWFAKNIFNDKGEIDNYFEFDKKLMQHPDWEYGPEAREKVGDSVKGTLQDMGLMG